MLGTPSGNIESEETEMTVNDKQKSLVMQLLSLSVEQGRMENVDWVKRKGLMVSVVSGSDSCGHLCVLLLLFGSFNTKKGSFNTKGQLYNHWDFILVNCFS